MIKKNVLSAIILIILSCLNTAKAVHIPKVSQEKLHAMQTHLYETSDKKRVFFAVINVLQNSDFIVENYDYDLGFIYARKIFKTHYVNKKRVAGWSTVLAATTAYTVFSYGSTAYSMYNPSRRVMTEMKDKTAVVDVNVFVTLNNQNQTQVRFLPVEKILQNADGYSFMTAAPMRVIRIYNSKIYNEFFKQIEEIITNANI